MPSIDSALDVRSYKELSTTYKISHFMPDNPDDYDIIVTSAGSGYATKKYRIIKNTPGLSLRELAEICDCGGYNFGYRMEGADIVVIYID